MPSRTLPVLVLSALVLCPAAGRADAAAGAAQPSSDEVEEALVRAPVIGGTELAPYFAQGDLRRAAAELQAGLGAQALKLIPAKSGTFPAKWLRALALRSAGQPAAAKKAFEQIALLGGPLADRAVHL